MEKIKNLSALRIVAFAVAIAIILGLSSVMLSFTASAENVLSDRVTLEDGTKVPTINGFSIIGSKAVTNIMVSYIRKTYGDGLIFLIAQDKTTKDIYYSRYPQAYLHDKEYLYCYFPGGYDCTAPFATSDSSVYDYFYIDDTYTAHHEGFGRSYKPSFYNASVEAVSPDLANLNYYWCYTNSIPRNRKNAISLSTIIGKSDNSGFKEGVKAPPSGGSENGRFICFGNYKDYFYDEHLADILSESIEYTKPTNKNKYWGRGTCYFRDDSVTSDWCSERVDSHQIIEYKSTEIAFSYFNNSDNLGACSVRLSLTEPRFMEREVDTPLENPIKYLVQHKLSFFHHARNVVISCDSFRNIPANSTLTAKFDLTGFVPLGGASYVLLELVDSISGDVVSSVMIHSPVNNGSVDKDSDKIDVNYGYKDGNTTVSDVNEPDDTGHLNGVPDGGLDESNRKFVSNYENANISDIFGTLDSSVNSISDFFQMTWGLIPLAISTIIIGGFAILVLLRILGR